MAFRSLRWLAAMAMLAILPLTSARAQYTIKEAETDPPQELDKSIAGLLNKKAVQFLDGKGDLLCEVWFRQDVPSTATAQQLKNGLAYHDLQETTLLGALRVDKAITDYRKQKIKPGVYTLRLAFQPQDGDHMGTAPYQEFCLLVRATDDKKPDPLKDAKQLHDLSIKAAGTSHPAVLLLFPVKDPGDTAKLVKMEDNTWVVARRLEVATKDGKGTLPIGLALVGVSSAA
jgi:hypothetical protein